MTLSREEKKILSEYRMEKARKALEDGKFNLKHGKFSVAVNRFYYVALNAARALLILKGVDPTTHSGIKTMLSMHFVREGLLEKDTVEDFKALLLRRTDVDYGDFEEVDKEKAEDSLLRAERFLKKAVSLQKSLIDQL
jgi:uncharacterized protein (UPF0332 family)